MSEILDLFGHPVRPGYGHPGRPSYEPTQQDRNKVKLLLAAGWSINRISNGVGVSPATVKRYFRAELKLRDAMRDRLIARQLEIAMEQANAGNVAALKQLDRLLEKNDLMVYGQPQPPASEEKPPKLGKKEQALADAQRPDRGSTLGELMARRQQPPDDKLN